MDNGPFDKDPATYRRERDSFIRDLQHFHDTKGTPFRRLPVLGGQEVDLYMLYTLVTNSGGWIKVNSRNTWTEILPHFKIPSLCVNASVGLKQIYLRYLDRWEKVHFLGEDGERGSDDDEESRHKRWSARALHSVPYTYNYSQHNIAESNREYNHLSCDLYKPSDYDRLALSLISPLPNEQDFAINVCTLLSNDGKHTLKLERHPRIVSFLLGHAGVFGHESLRKVFLHHYTDVRRHPVENFWRDVLEWRDSLELTREANFIEKKTQKVVDARATGTNFLSQVPIDDLVAATAATSSSSLMDCDLVDGDCVIVGGIEFPAKIRLEREDEALFSLKRSLGTQDYVGQRVMQVATILRNLSFIEENVATLLENVGFLRFALLCASSQWGALKNLGLDMLSNMAGEFLVKDAPNDLLSTTLIRIVVHGLNSEDRSLCISSLDVLNKLSQNENNEDALIRSLEAQVYKRVCNFLTIHDVMLLIYTLECLYSLSSLGEKSCHYIVANHGVIDTLVSLVTVEGKSYGPKACIGMKLVETVTGSASSQQQQQQQQAQSAAAATPAAAVAVSGSSVVAVAPVKVVSPSTPLRTVQVAPRLIAVTPSSSSLTQVVGTTTLVATPSTTNSSSSLAAAAIVTTSSSPMTPQQMIQQQHAHQQAIHENEQFALAWLRATYEPCAAGKVEHQELYKHYMNSCSKIGRKGVISPLHFPRCVRSVFGGTVGPNPVRPANAGDPQYYDGIKAIAHPHLSQALLGAATTASATTAVATASPSAAKDGQSSSTSLIKSLLANKVNDCMSTVSMKTTDCQNVAQVAARQQQQRMLAQQNSVQNTPTDTQKKGLNAETPKTSRLNGARQLFNDIADAVGDPAVTSTTQLGVKGGKKEPPQPPPPPLAPLSNNKAKTKVENEDSDSLGNSLSSSTGLGTVGVGGISSTEDGENSLTSFEGLLNGVPNMDTTPLNEDSNSKDDNIVMNKPLRLADLLEKKVEKSSTMLMNGVLNKDLKEKGVDLVDNHIEKALRDTKSEIIQRSESEDIEDLLVANSIQVKKPSEDEDDGDFAIDDDSMEDDEAEDAAAEDKKTEKTTLKRPAGDDIVESEPKKPLLNINGSKNPDSPAPDSVTSSNGEEPAAAATASTAAAKLFADLAADILEDEDEEQLMQEAAAPTISIPEPAPGAAAQPQLVVEASPGGGSQVQLTRQIIVSQGNGQVVVKPQPGAQAAQQTVIVNAGAAGQQRNPVVIQQANQQFVLSSGIQGQMQLVPGAQPGQFVLQASGTPQGATAYMVAQPQTAVVHGQQQTVLVAQTSQQQGTGAKTIIILQQQPANNAATHHQKVVVTPQGQQVVVTQVPRPVIHQSSVSTSGVVVSTTNKVATVAIKAASPTTVSAGATAITATATNGEVVVVKEEKPKIIRDLTTAFVCEWGQCNVETKFKSANQVFMHVCEAHCPQEGEEVLCEWDHCDNMKRKKFSLMTHVQDKHCNPESMKQNLVRRKKEAQGIKVEVPAPATSSSHPGYAPDAALHAIKRHALEFVNPKELQDDNEGPVTKSIRLTASLILRNLVIYNSHCKRYLKSYESHLANVALSNVESSRTIAQILYDMNEKSNHNR